MIIDKPTVFICYGAFLLVIAIWKMQKNELEYIRQQKIITERRKVWEQKIAAYKNKKAIERELK